MKNLFVIVLFLAISSNINSQVITDFRNNKSQTTEWDLKGDVMEINNIPYYAIKGYSDLTMSIIFIYKPIPGYNASVDQIRNDKTRDNNPKIIKYKVVFAFARPYVDTIKVFKITGSKELYVEKFDNFKENTQ